MRKVFFAKTVVIVLSLFCITSCSNNTPSKNGAPGTQGSTIYPNKMKIEYSKNFAIEYFDNYKLISVFSPDEKRSLIFQYLLLPEKGKNPEGYPNAMTVRTPVKSVISLTSIYIGFLDKLNLTDKIIAVDKYDYVNSIKANKLIEEKKISEVGESFSLNVEKVFELNPELILTFGNGNPLVDGNPKLIKNGLHVASTTIHLENSPLARAEWIKFVAAFFDYEKEANEIFDTLVKRYNDLAALTKNIKTRPSVFTEALFGGMWYEPGGGSYLAKLLNDAGADYPWKEDKASGSLKLTYEQVYEKAHNADFWVNVHFWNNLGDALKNDPRNSKFKAYKTKNIYNYNVLVNRYGFYEYWENGVINCDVVLSDLIKIFHPELLPGYRMVYYKKLAD
jgi:iron complex transport system substrate-binding protein